MLNRNETKSARAVSDLKAELGTNTRVSFIKMDLADLASVHSAAEEVLAGVPKIDALIQSRSHQAVDGIGKGHKV